MKTQSLKICLAIIVALCGSVGAGFASDLPPCPSSGNKHGCFGKWTSSAGLKYVGEWENNQANGQGTYTWVSGDKFVGEFKNGEKNGKGTFKFADGDVYEGMFKDGQFIGK